jgi:hypothetical protein
MAEAEAAAVTEPAVPENGQPDPRALYIQSVLDQIAAADDPQKMRDYLFADVLYNLVMQATFMQQASTAMQKGGLGGILGMLRG